jgi:hypothetical protein
MVCIELNTINRLLHEILVLTILFSRCGGAKYLFVFSLSWLTSNPLTRNVDVSNTKKIETHTIVSNTTMMQLLNALYHARQSHVLFPNLDRPETRGSTSSLTIDHRQRCMQQHCYGLESGPYSYMQDNQRLH